VTARRDGLIVCCAISAGVHAALAPEHLRESAVTGAGFAVATGALVVAGVGLTARPGSRAVTSFTILVLLGLLLGYAVAATSGIPVLHPEVDPVDAVGLLTKAVEALGLVLAVRLPALARGRTIPVGLAGLIAVFSALVALSLAGQHQMSGM
jgi:hypothetical protein